MTDTQTADKKRLTSDQGAYERGERAALLAALQLVHDRHHPRGGFCDALPESMRTLLTAAREQSNQ